MKKRVWEMPLTWGKRYDDNDISKLIRSRKQRAVLAVIHRWLSPGRKPGREASKCHCIVDGIPWLVKDYRTMAKEASDFLLRNEEQLEKFLKSKAAKGDKWAKEQHDKLLHRWDYCHNYKLEMTVHAPTVTDAVNKARDIGILFAVDGNHRKALGEGKSRFRQTYFTLDYVRLDQLVEAQKSPYTEGAKSVHSTSQIRTLKGPNPYTPPPNPYTLIKHRFLHSSTEVYYSVPNISVYLREKKEQAERSKRKEQEQEGSALLISKEKNQIYADASASQSESKGQSPGKPSGYEQFFERNWKGGDIPSLDQLPDLGSTEWGKLHRRIKQHYSREVNEWVSGLMQGSRPNATH